MSFVANSASHHRYYTEGIGNGTFQHQLTGSISVVGNKMAEPMDCDAVTVVGNLLKQRVEHMHFPISRQKAYQTSCRVIPGRIKTLAAILFWPKMCALFRICVFITYE